MQVMALVHIVRTVDLVDLIAVVGLTEITCIRVMEEVMGVCTVGPCITAEWEEPMVAMVWGLWAWVLTTRVQIHLGLQHHPQVFGCPSYEW